MVVEDRDLGRPAFFGCVGFASPSSVATVLAGNPRRFRDALLRSEWQRRPVFLAPKQLRAANASGDLALLHISGAPDDLDFTNPRVAELHRVSFSAFMTHCAGYRIAEFWQENLLPEASLYAESMGMVHVRDQTLDDGKTSSLFRFTREDVMVRPGAQLAFLMNFPPPRLGFSLAQQRLLELALLDYSDGESAKHLGISLEAIRKRWRSIHARHSFGEGKDQRRALLAYIRQNMEELRPWPSSRVTGATAVMPGP
ncbi:helix-turn-helix transcriptional regulator [Paludibaculum fermentans]|uniref:helix-turn-helix transcriptional regulator n=1 Tax=Paludibaculum fermentans TaxID=1473598 RepID=UPI003EBE91D1